MYSYGLSTRFLFVLVEEDLPVLVKDSVITVPLPPHVPHLQEAVESPKCHAHCFRDLSADKNKAN